MSLMKIKADPDPPAHVDSSSDNPKHRKKMRTNLRSSVLPAPGHSRAATAVRHQLANAPNAPDPDPRVNPDNLARRVDSLKAHPKLRLNRKPPN